MAEAGILNERESESDGISSVEGDGDVEEMIWSDDETPGVERDGPQAAQPFNGPWIRLLDPEDFVPRHNHLFDSPTGPIDPPRYINIHKN